MGVNAQIECALTYVGKNGTKATPNWRPISQDVVGISINGDTIDTEAIRNAGKALLIDYSATWCSWCWVMHTHGLLEAVHHQLGDEVQVVWVEADPNTGAAGITGSGNTQGDWTNGGTVPYPIIDDPAFTNIIGGNSAINGYPTVVFVSPSGYWCSVYNQEWGFGPYDSTEAVNSVSRLIQECPVYGVPPRIHISGSNTAVNGSNTMFNAEIISLDSVTNISWTFEGATIPTANTAMAYTTWTTDGTYEVTLSVTNTIGTSYDTLMVNVISWDWGDTMGYGLGHDDEAAGLFRVATFNTWAVMFPAAFMDGRQYMKSVDVYTVGTQDYTLSIHQGGNYAPGTKIYTRTEKGHGEGWQTFNISGPVPIDQNENLWITIRAASDGGYPMSGYENGSEIYYCGDKNSSWVLYQDRWQSMLDFGESYACTWAIKAVTGDTPNVEIDAPNYPCVSLYPNPTYNKIIIEADNFVNAEVMDITGRKLMTSTDSTVDISNLPQGLYMFRINTTQGSTIQKVLKK